MRRVTEATLKFLELELSAVGLINTRLPNNQPGFSLLLCISVIFEPAYRLPYLFTLEGVGGLIGVNRTMKIDVLRERIRDGAINSIMFPTNIVENAAKIISDLRAIFPPQAKHFVVAPFLKIGWGSPTVLDTRLVDLRVDIFGDFNFAESYVLIEGLFFSLKIRLNESWGGEQKAVPATVAADTLFADLKRQLGQKNNWTARLTPGFSRAEALRSSDDTDTQDRILVHPGGSLEIRQTLVPLNRSIERFGNSKVDNRPVYRIESYRLGNGPTVAVAQQEILREHFARGQFEDLPDKEKIAAADFEMMPAGIRLRAGEAFDIPTEVESSANDFEEIVLHGEPSEPGATPRVFATRAPAVYNWQVERSLNLSAARRPADATRPEEVFALLETLPDYREKNYEIVSKASLKAPADLAGRQFRTRSEALDYFNNRWGEWSAEWQIWEVTEEA